MRKPLIASALFVVVALAGCAEREEPQRDAETAATGTAGAATLRVADIMADPARYAGQTVTVEADVEEVRGPMAFTLDEDAPLAGGIDNDILVLSRKAANLSAIDDQWVDNRVRVTGTVGRWSVVEIEREIGWDLDPHVEADLEQEGTVLLASAIERVERDR